MPRDKKESHNRIVKAAKEEFLEYGYIDASLRRIASKAGIGVSGIYKHFSSKEELFDPLVEPTMEEFYNLYKKIEEQYFEEIDDISDKQEWSGQNETVLVTEFLYDHLEEFDLIINKSKGTKYENFINNVAKLEEEVTLRYMKELRKSGLNVKEFDKKEFHLLVTAYIESVFQPIVHGLTKKEALHYANTFEEFLRPAWKTWFGM